jgi:hypothetical protein
MSRSSKKNLQKSQLARQECEGLYEEESSYSFSNTLISTKNLRQAFCNTAGCACGGNNYCPHGIAKALCREESCLERVRRVEAVIQRVRGRQYLSPDRNKLADQTFLESTEELTSTET